MLTRKTISRNVILSGVSWSHADIKQTVRESRRRRLTECGQMKEFNIVEDNRYPWTRYTIECDHLNNEPQQQ